MVNKIKNAAPAATVKLLGKRGNELLIVLIVVAVVGSLAITVLPQLTGAISGKSNQVVNSVNDMNITN